MKYCKNCNNAAPDEASVCEACGCDVFLTEADAALNAAPAAEEAAETEAIAAEAVETESAEAESAEAESVKTEAAETESAEAESAEAEAIVAEVVETETAEAESAEAEAIVAEAVETEAAEAEAAAPAADSPRHTFKDSARRLRLWLRSFFVAPGEQPQRKPLSRIGVFCAFCAVVAVVGVIAVALYAKAHAPSPKATPGMEEEGYYVCDFAGFRFETAKMDELFPSKNDGEEENDVRLHFQDDSHVAYTNTECWYAGISEDGEDLFLIIHDTKDGYKADTVNENQNYMEYINSTIGFNANAEITTIVSPVEGLPANCQVVKNPSTGYMQYFLLMGRNQLKSKSDNDFVLLYFASADQAKIRAALDLIEPLA